MSAGRVSWRVPANWQRSAWQTSVCPVCNQVVSVYRVSMKMPVHKTRSGKHCAVSGFSVDAVNQMLNKGNVK